MIKQILDLLFDLILLFLAFMIISGYDFTLKPFAIKMYDWKQTAILFGIAILFFTACHISEKKGEKRAWKEIEEMVQEAEKVQRTIRKEAGDGSKG